MRLSPIFLIALLSQTLLACTGVPDRMSGDQTLVITPQDCTESTGAPIDFQYRVIRFYDDGSVRVNTDSGQYEVRLYLDTWKDLPRMGYIGQRSMRLIATDPDAESATVRYRSYVDTRGGAFIGS